MTPSPKIFLSYPREDIDIVNKIYQWLVENGCQVWMDTQNLMGGEKWEDTIRIEIEKSDFFVACISLHESNRRGAIHWERQEAMKVSMSVPDPEKFVIPLRLKECQIPNLFRKIHCLDWFRQTDQVKLLQTLKSGKTSSINKVIEEIESILSDKTELTDDFLTKVRALVNTQKSRSSTENVEATPDKLLRLTNRELLQQVNQHGLTSRIGLSILGELLRRDDVLRLEIKQLKQKNPDGSDENSPNLY